MLTGTHSSMIEIGSGYFLIEKLMKCLNATKYFGKKGSFISVRKNTF